MIRLEVINVLAEDQRPQVLAEEFDDVQRVVKPWAISREPIGIGVSNLRAEIP